MDDPRGPVSRNAGRRWVRRGAVLIVALAVAGIVATLLGSCASFGGKPDAAQQARIEDSPQWHDGRFHNAEPIWNDTGSALRRSFASTPGSAPDTPVPVVAHDGRVFATPPASGLRFTWFGHSSMLLEVDGARVLIDPVWSRRPSPVAWLGPARWYAPPLALEDLPAIDAVLISHDHYDHLDRETVEALDARRVRFVVPLGVGAHLRAWGIPAARIHELDWWESVRIGALDITATPARHASGRINPESNATLWAGFAIAGPVHRAWYSGDTGFHSSLDRIGERLGPFDLTLIEAGQYDADWPDWHLGPELAVEAHRRVRGEVMVPVHWALFKLAHHGWTEPAERVLAAAACRGVDTRIPRPGQSIEPARERTTRWWPDMPWQSAAEHSVVATLAGDPAQRVGIPDCRLVARPAG
ncbi:MBL fold metallo-hydrolase [Pseudoxanthomonas putridarboris]|uniref:MBL fold metallo-hydrolase n=1 Tax=Pseudoxanthomonas putridarboris TaxID=752605 RepID=A0ABU9J1S2_9GAMM